MGQEGRSRFRCRNYLDESAICPTVGIDLFSRSAGVEKYLKTLLIVNEIEAPRTHNLDLVYDLIPKAVRPALAKSELGRLTEYAVIPRYPGDYDPITLEDARSAVRLMRRLREDVRRRLPESVTGA